MSTYTELKKIVLPKLVNFKDDLLVYDKKALKNYKGKFLYGYRENGTNILLLDDVKDFDYTNSLKELQNILDNTLTYFKGVNNDFLFYDGEKLDSIKLDEVHTIFEKYAEKVFNRKEYIDSLNIDAISFDLQQLMNSNRRWKMTISENQTSDTLRRLRNHFDWFKIKKSNNLQDIKEQLLKTVN